jgi:hypothetical protein
MNHDEAWRQRVRSTLRAPREDDASGSATLASAVIVAGTRRLAARAGARAATLGLLVALAVVLGLLQWARVEAARTAAATLAYGAPWTP